MNDDSPRSNSPMIPRLPLLAAVLLAPAVLAADKPKLPEIPSKPIAVKKELLFEDDFSAATPAKPWHRVVDTFTFEDGSLKGTQTRDKDMPSKDGKSVIKAHAAVHGLEIPTTDSIVECRVKFDGATMIDVEFDDRKFTGCHYGHICRAQVRLNGVTIIDEKDGNMRNDIYAMKKDPAKKEEVAKLLVGRQATFPAKLEAGKWYSLVVETAGDEMRVSIDGKPVAFLKSSGIAHATKSKIELGVAGKTGSFDDLKVWNAAPAKN
ncbi:MAG: hypothetical protein JNG86_10425 [Verrucomicrobiaceae bacterium]|nr:hypothetical protein [Verrucomicrobiaceae bacterium]